MTGNLYTHARHHTGMVFHCTTCSFTSANRSHLTEHEQTHQSHQRTCELCRRNYKTLKSLVNHTRKYHAQTSAGASYLTRLNVVYFYYVIQYIQLSAPWPAVYIFTNEKLQYTSTVMQYNKPSYKKLWLAVELHYCNSWQN